MKVKNLLFKTIEIGKAQNITKTKMTFTGPKILKDKDYYYININRAIYLGEKRNLIEALDKLLNGERVETLGFQRYYMASDDRMFSFIPYIKLQAKKDGVYDLISKIKKEKNKNFDELKPILKKILKTI